MQYTSRRETDMKHKTLKNVIYNIIVDLPDYIQEYYNDMLHVGYTTNLSIIDSVDSIFL